MNKVESRRRFVPRLEALEDRSLPALFGVPWPDASHLTISFAPDGTMVAGKPSNLFARMDVQLPRAVWQADILRAFQTWAINANINFSVVSDGGQRFGAPGLTQGDPRFGDIRIAALPLSPAALAVSVPLDPYLSGTWAGDILLNSSVAFNSSKLFPVMLHEVGHILGLGESKDPHSIMYPRLGTQRTLSAGDIAALQHLYGARQGDQWEGPHGNNTLATAANITPPSAPGSDTFDGGTPLLVFGDVTTTSQGDYFSIHVPADYSDAITFQVQTTGLSLLAPSLTIYDSTGHVLGHAEASGSTGGTISVQIGEVTPSQTYFARVTGARSDVFAVGRYALVASFDSNSIISDAQLQAIVQGAPATISEGDTEEALRRPSQVLFNNDGQPSSNFQTAQALKSAAGFGALSRYVALGSLATPTDVNFYRIQAPPAVNGQDTVLTVDATSALINGTLPAVRVYDAQRRPVPVQVVVNGNGSFTIQATGLTGGATYYLRVAAAPGSAHPAGNYNLTALFGHQAAPLTPFTSGTLKAGSSDQYRFFVALPQLFQLNLAATGSSGAVRMELLNASGTLVQTLTVRPGQTITGDTLLLVPGTYTVRFVLVGRITGPLGYSLSGVVLSDPIGPVLHDPTYTPQFVSPSNPNLFFYPGNVSWAGPFFWVLIDPHGSLVLHGAHGQILHAFPVIHGVVVHHAGH
jgi:hypothetical protein